MPISSDTDPGSDGVAAGDILVVDDNASNLLAMEAALDALGVRVVRAQSGEEALRVLLEHIELRRRTAQVTKQSEQLRAHERREHERSLDEERRRWVEEALRQKKEEMAEADRRKDEFLAVLGHELRNPLSAIVLGCEMLSRKLVTASGPDQALGRTLDRIDRQAQHLRLLVDDLLDLARINSGKIELKRASTSIQYIIEQAVATSLPAIEARAHRVSVDVPSEIVTLWADPVRLIQVVGNLLNNAARYTDDGGSLTVTCVLKEKAGLIEVRVSDNGCGMAPDLLPRVFDVFVQEQPNGTGHGLGLGLTIVKRLVAMHQGTVTAASEGVGRGSTFTVTLPLDVQHAAAVTPADTNPHGAGAALKRAAKPLLIVLVEDNQDIRESMKELLIELGHTVHSAADGGSGADLILSVRPDVAIVDIGLPILDGYQLAALIRSRSSGARVRLVALTGYGQKSDRNRAREAGFDAFLVKPADTTALVAILSSQQNESAELLSARES